MVNQVDNSILDQLCPELRTILVAELARGNIVNETSLTWGLGGGTVWLVRRFAERPMPEGITCNRLPDHHDGYAECVCLAHGQTLISGLSA